MKYLYALWQADAAGLLSPALRERLAAAGCARLQVNLDDEHVAHAQLRITAFEAAPDAVVSVWAPGIDPEPVTAALQELAGRLVGWSVSERVPLAAPPVPEGERAEQMANVAFLRRPEEMAPPEWRASWLDRHTTVAIRTQATSGYVQDLVTGVIAGDPPRVDGIVEELFAPEAATDLHAFYGSGGSEEELQRRMEAMMASIAEFGADRDLTVVPTSRYRWELFTATDLRHLRRCADLAEEALEAGDEPFGSLLVSATGEVLREDRNRVAAGDRTQHPEFNLARWAASALSVDERAAATVYTSGEHCPMCSAAHAWVGLGRIVYVHSSAQLLAWRTEMGVTEGSPVAPLPIQQVAPGVPVQGPVPELEDRMRALHRRLLDR